jgi:hypothetical protein
MKTFLFKLAAAGVLVAATVLGGAPAASAQGPVIPVETLFGGSGTGPTFEDALASAIADAEAQAAANGFTDCAVVGDPLVWGSVRPGFPVIYHALVTIGCTA